MNEIETLLAYYRFSRGQTLGLLQKIEESGEAATVLGWRPGPGRAHLAWQLMHIGITEELFATERLVPGSVAGFADLVPRFKGGSTPDDRIPSVSDIREVLNASRAHLEATLSRFTPAQLDEVPEPLKERGWTLRTVLNVLGWHEAHHQGQAHITFNLYKARAEKR
ncbi:MAG: hypothetical protein AMXMBFR83_00260 [Phycisphaerae bacterium]